jgi:hypothetical protein
MFNRVTNKTWERRLSSSAFTFLFYEKGRQRQLPPNMYNYTLPKIKRASTVDKDLWVLSN